MTVGHHRIRFCHRVAIIVGALGVAGSSVPFAASAAPAVEPQHIVVTLDKAKLIKMPEHVDTIVVGSPIIADVTMLKKNGLVVITGKGFGETNVIFLDGSGQALSEAVVSVQPGSSLVTVQRGLDRESYSCDPRCEPTLALGDATKFLQDTTSQINTRNGLAVPAAGH